MRYEKRLGLAAFAVFALLALAGPGGAPATQICEQAQSGGDGKCPNGSSERELAKGESFTLAASDLVLTSPNTYVSCSNSSIRLKMTSKNSISLVRGVITALSFDGCETSGGTACETSVANLPYDAVVHPPDVIVSDEDGMPIQLNCGFLVSCELIGEEHLLEVEDDQIVASAERPAAKKGLCPAWPRLDATYSAQPELTFSK